MPDERGLGLLAGGDILLDAHRIQEAAFGVPYARGRDRDPDSCPVLADEALFVPVAVDLASHLTLELTQVRIDILRQSGIEHRPADKFIGGIAEQVGQVAVDAPEFALRVDFSDANRRMLVSCSEPLLLLPNDLIAQTPVRDVMETVDGSDDPTVLVFDRFDVDHHPYRRAVRPLELSFNPPDGNAGSQHRGHRGLGARDLPSIEIEPVGSAIEFAVRAKQGRSPPQIGSALVEPKQSALRVASVDRNGQRLDEVGRDLQGDGVLRGTDKPLGSLKAFDAHLPIPLGNEKPNASDRRRFPREIRHFGIEAGADITAISSCLLDPFSNRGAERPNDRSHLADPLLQSGGRAPCESTLP